MSEVMIPIKGGGGTSSDDLTATKAQVLEGYTAVTKDSDDEAAGGTMKNVASIDPAKSITASGSNAYIRMTNGAHIQNASSGYPEVSVPLSDLGDAEAANVLAGKTFTSSAGLKVSGTMVDRGTNQYSGGIAVVTGTKPYIALNAAPEGWYHSNGNSWAPEMRHDANALGNATAAQIRSGYTATSVNGLKLSGTLAIKSAISFSAAAISYNTIRISWKNPSKGPWQGVFIQISTSGYPGTGGGSRAYTGSGWQNQSVAGGSNYVDITGLNPSTTYYFTCTSYCDALGWGSSYNVSATTNAITVEAILSGKWSTGSSMTAELVSGSKYYMYNKYLEKISGNHIYTTNNQHYARGSSYSSPNYSYFTLYDLSGVTQTQVDQLNTYFNRMNTYENTASAYSDTVYKSGVTVSFSLVSSTQIQVNMGTKGPFYIAGPQHVYFYKA